MKKGLKIILIVVAVFLCISACGSSTDDDPSTASASSTSESTDIEEIVEEEQEPEVFESNDDHLYIKDYVEYTDGTVVTITGAGYTSNVTGEPLVFVDMDVENSSDNIISFSNDEFYMYIDDYQVDVVYARINDSEYSSYVEVNPGRKAKFTFRSQLPNDYRNATKIEVEFPGSVRTLLIRDGGIDYNGVRPEDYVDNSLDELLYGNHANMDGNDTVLILEPSDNNEVSALVSLKRYDGTYSYYLLFMEDDTNGYLTLLSGLSKVGYIYFREDGIEFGQTDSSDGYHGLYAYNQQDISSAEMDIPREYDSEGILGRYTQVGNPSILLFVEEFDGIVFTVDSGNDIISAGMGGDGLLYLGTDDDAPIAGSFTIDGDKITLFGMENTEFNGTYQKE